MSSTPNHRAIHENLISTLAAIAAGTNSYNHTIVGADRVFRDPYSFGASELPRVMVIADPEVHRFEHNPGRQLRVIAPYDIIGLVSAADADARMQALARLEDDIIAALEVDTNRGTTSGVPNATMTRFVDAWLNPSIDDDRNSSGGTGMLVIRIECVYHRSLSLTAPLA